MKFCEDNQCSLNKETNCNNHCHNHSHFSRWFGFNWYMHTQPLLFDECITIEEKISVLWNKLHFLMEKSKEFLNDFCPWADEIENTIKDLQAQVTALKEKLESEVNRLDERIDELDTRLTQKITELNAKLEQKVRELLQKINELDGKIDAIKEEIDARLTQIEQNITSINAHLNTHDTEIENLNQHITSITQSLQELTNRITTLESDYNNLVQQISELKSNYTDLSQRLSTLENTVNNISESITNITNNISGVTTDIDDLKRRVTDIETKLANLRIDYPVEVITDEDMTTKIAPSWLAWMKTICPGMDNQWETVRRLSPSDGTDVKGGLIIGRVIANSVECKLPLIARHPIPFMDKTGTAIEQSALTNSVAEHVQTFITQQNLDNLLMTYQSNNGFFDIELSNTYPVQLDEFKFFTSYLPFSVNSVNMGNVYPLFTAYNVYVDNSYHNYFSPCNGFNCNVRLQFTANEKAAKLCVSTPALYFALIDDYFYLYMVAEVG